MRTRSARGSDRHALAVFATDTFDWGDYVLDSLERWLIEEQSALRVAVDSNDRAVAIAQASMLSDTEAWLQGARVHPDHRRRGIASTLGGSCLTGRETVGRSSPGWQSRNGIREPPPR